jgi:hypothetical protein
MKPTWIISHHCLIQSLRYLKLSHPECAQSYGMTASDKIAGGDIYHFIVNRQSYTTDSSLTGFGQLACS